MTDPARTQTAPARPWYRGRRVLAGLGVATLLLGLGAALMPLAMPASSAAVIGWLLLLAGTFEITAGTVDDPGDVRKARIAAGGITAFAGLLFILNPVELFPTVYIVVAWLLLRGAILLAGGFRGPDAPRLPLVTSGLADIVLAAVLVAGMPVAAYVVSVFGPTPELVAHFAWVFAVSFLVTGLSLLFEPIATPGGERYSG